MLAAHHVKVAGTRRSEFCPEVRNVPGFQHIKGIFTAAFLVNWVGEGCSSSMWFQYDIRGHTCQVIPLAVKGAKNVDQAENMDCPLAMSTILAQQTSARWRD